jgi:VCBS repeat-containing protein
LTFTLVTGPAHGTLTLNANGTFTYTAARQPTAGFAATDSFTVRANDGLANSAARTVNVTLTPVNDAPVVAAVGPIIVAEGAAAGGTLTATDADGDALTFTLVTGPAHGTLTLNADGTFTYVAARQPTVGFAAADTFTVRANDGLANSVARTVNVTLTPVNDAPVLAPIAPITLAVGAVASGALTATDADGDALTFTLVTGPAHGTVTFNADGTFTYNSVREATPLFVEADAFSVSAGDGLTNSAAQTVKVTLTGNSTFYFNIYHENRRSILAVDLAPLTGAGGSLILGGVGAGTEIFHQINLAGVTLAFSRDAFFYAQVDITFHGFVFMVPRNPGSFGYQKIVVYRGQLVTGGAMLALEADGDRYVNAVLP